MLPAPARTPSGSTLPGIAGGPAGRRVAIEAVGLFVALVAAVTAGPGMRAIWERPLWLDEIVSWTIATHGTWDGLVERVASGADWNPPLHYIVVRLAALLVDHAEVAARLPSILAIGATGAVVYASVRRQWPAEVALLAVVAVLGHPVVRTTTMDARPYALWLALTAALALSHAANRPWRTPLHAGLGVLVVTTHYFGALVLGAFLAASIPFRSLRSPDAWRTWLSRQAGLLIACAAAAALIPLFREQQLLLGGETWQSPAGWREAGDFLAYPWRWRPLYLFGLLIVASLARPAWRAALAASLQRAAGDPVMRSLAAVLLVPVAVVFISLLIAPAMLARYQIPVFLAASVLAVIAVAHLPRVARIVVLLLVLRNGALTWRRGAADAERLTARATQMMRDADRVTRAGVRIVALEREDAYSLARGVPSARAALLFVPDSLVTPLAATRVNRTEAVLRVERGFGRALAQSVALPPDTLTVEAARALPFVAYVATDPADAAPAVLFPDFRECARSGAFVILARPGPCPALPR